MRPGPHTRSTTGRRGRERGGRALDAVARSPPATGGDRKTNTEDALHVAQVALFRHDLRPVEPEDQTTILRLLTERHDDLAHERTCGLKRLHAVLRDLLPGGPPRACPPKRSPPS